MTKDEIQAALDYFTAKDNDLTNDFCRNYYLNGCPPEIRQVVVSSLLEKTRPTDKMAEYALRPFNNGFKDGVNGQTFTFNREQVAIIKSALSLKNSVSEKQDSLSVLGDKQNPCERRAENGTVGQETGAARIPDGYVLVSKDVISL